LSTEGAEYVPTTFAISQNFPNPFNPSTTIRFQIPERASVLLKVYDMLGREVATLVNEEKNPGFFTVSWNGRNQYGQPVASGVYFYRMVAAKSSNQANSFSGIRRMLLLK
jgi:flagellar hook assembly protein FlgD